MKTRSKKTMSRGQGGVWNWKVGYTERRQTGRWGHGRNGGYLSISLLSRPNLSPHITPHIESGHVHTQPSHRTCAGTCTSVRSAGEWRPPRTHSHITPRSKHDAHSIAATLRSPPPAAQHRKPHHTSKKFNAATTHRACRGRRLARRLRSLRVRRPVLRHRPCPRGRPHRRRDRDRPPHRRRARARRRCR